MSQDITDIISRRFSCRSYQARPISADHLAVLQDCLDSLGPGPLGSDQRFAVAAKAEGDDETLRGLGSYGFIRGAVGYIIGAVAAGPHAMEDFGYRMEEAILAATRLGIGTCWLGGSFTKSSFASRMGVRAGESVPAVISIGYPAAGSEAGWIRRRAGGDKRLPPAQLFYEGSFGQPLDLAATGPYAEALAMVRLAPSASNKQPWRILRQGDAWHFFLARTPGYGKGSLIYRLLGLADLQRLDIGIAMCHFELTARAGGLSGCWQVLADPPLKNGPAAEYIVSWQPQ